MKKELFYEVIDLILNTPVFMVSPYKVTETDEIISYSFDLTTDGPRENMERIKGHAAKFGWKDPELPELVHNKPAYKEYYTILYNKVKDKISLGRFMVGYGYSGKKHRVYPYRIKVPVLCVSKHIYCFWHKNKPRIFTSTYSNNAGEWNSIITRAFLKVGYRSNLRIPYRHFINTNNEWEAMENYFGRPIPLILRAQEAYVIYHLYKEFFGERSKGYELEVNLNLRKVVPLLPAPAKEFSL
jgi:hypothetical protein